MNVRFVLALPVFVAAVSGCKIGSSRAEGADAGNLVAVDTASSAPAVPVAPAAAPDAASPSASRVGTKPNAAKGCPDGWTRTTKGICVDWCEETSDCDDGKTCQASAHVDPDLGKIKTCQTAPKAAFPGSKCKANENEMGDECARVCKKDVDCAPAGTCTHFDSAAFRASPDMCTWNDGSFTPPATGKPKAAPACTGSAVSDEVECANEICPDGWAGGTKVIGGARAGACLRKCKSAKDCKVKGNLCISGVCDSGSE